MTLDTHNTQLAAIGAVIGQPDLAAKLKAGWFTDPNLARLAAIIQREVEAGRTIDASVVVEAANRHGIEGAADLVARCYAECPSPSLFPQYSADLEDAMQRRRIVAIGQRAVEAAADPDTKPGEIVEQLERDLFATRTAASGDAGEWTMRDTLRGLIDQYQANQDGTRQPGIRTGLAQLDHRLCGLHPGQLCILAGRPAQGKTSFAMNIAEFNVKAGLPVLVFSLEMTAAEIVNRLVCGLCGIDSAGLHRGDKLNDQELTRLAQCQKGVARLPLHIVDRAGLTCGQIASLTRRYCRDQGIRLVIADHLGLIQPDSRKLSRYETITATTGALKRIAKDAGLPVLALCQLNRDNDREGREPRLSDLRDSGSIEQDGDQVLLLHHGQDQSSIIIAKNRHGGTGKIEVVFDRQRTRFTEAPL